MASKKQLVNNQKQNNTLQIRRKELETRHPSEASKERLCFENAQLDPNVRSGFRYSPQSWVTNVSKISENDFQAASLLGSR